MGVLSLNINIHTVLVGMFTIIFVVEEVEYTSFNTMNISPKTAVFQQCMKQKTKCQLCHATHMELIYTVIAKYKPVK